MYGVLQSGTNLFAVISSAPEPPETTRYYVSTSGNNANDGRTESTPWQTPQYANDNAVPGSTIALKKGDTFLGLTALAIDNGGTADNRMIWDGALWGSGANATISASGDKSAPNLAIVNISQCEYLTFQNITVDGNDNNCFGIVIGGGPINYYSSLVQGNESDIIIQDCEILDCGAPTDAYCISVLVQTWNTDMDTITIRRNTVDGNTNHGIGVYLWRSGIGGGGSLRELTDAYIGYNTITNCGEKNDGVSSCISISGKVTDAIIEHNTITQGATGHAPGISVSSNEDAGYYPTGMIIRWNDVRLSDEIALNFNYGRAISGDVYGNILMSDTIGGGIHAVVFQVPTVVWTGARMNFYFNDIISVNGGGGLFECTPITDSNAVVLRNNILINLGVGQYANSCFAIDCVLNNHSNNLYYRTEVTDCVHIIEDSVYIYRTGVVAWEGTAIITDPTFTVEFTNLHVQTGSPVIGAGVAISGIDEDIEGNPMQDYIGAYQTIENP